MDNYKEICKDLDFTKLEKRVNGISDSLYFIYSLVEDIKDTIEYLPYASDCKNSMHLALLKFNYCACDTRELSLKAIDSLYEKFCI